MRLSRLLLLAFICFSSLSAPSAVWAFDPMQTYVSAQFLPPDLLPPPPAEGSKEWRAQINAVLQAERRATQADLAAAVDEQKMRLELMTSVMGPTFTRDRLPKTFALLDHVLEGARQVSEADKKFWHTRRPYLTDKRVKLYVDPIDNSPAYPSGHTSESLVLAEVLGMLDPDKRPALRVRAAAIARHRIEAGVHYPCDIEGGRMLAMLIVGSLTGNDDFQDDLAAAKKELRAN